MMTCVASYHGTPNWLARCKVPAPQSNSTFKSATVTQWPGAVRSADGATVPLPITVSCITARFPGTQRV